MAASDSKAVPIKNSAYRITFPILDADGDLVTGATGLDSEVSIDGGTFADCTNEATEIATASGMYFLDLTSAEMNGDTIAIIVKTTSSGAKTTPLVLYTAARSINDLAYPTTTGRSIDVDASGGVEVGSFQAGAITAAAIATDAIDDDAIATGAIASTAFAAGAINAAAIASDAITDAKVASDVTIASVTGAVGSVTGNVGGNVTGSVGSVATGGITTGSFAAGAINAAAIATDAIGAAELAADAVTEIQSGLATAAALTIVDDFLDTEIAALTTNLATANAALVTIAGYLDTEIAALTSNLSTANANIVTIDDLLDTEMPALTAAVAALPASVATAVSTIAGAEPTTVPAPTADLNARLSYLVLQLRNLLTQTATVQTLYQDDGTTVFSTRAVSDNGTTFTRAEETTA